MRIGYMIEVLGVNPSRIKAVTFSRASADDMKERFAKFFPHLPTVDFSTIHSLAFQVVRQTLERQAISYDAERPLAARGWRQRHAQSGKLWAANSTPSRRRGARRRSSCLGRAREW